MAKISDNQDLKNYFTSLDNFDEKNVEISQFLQKLDEEFELQSVVDKFKWSEEYFTELDILLIRVGYAARTDLRDQIKEFIYEKIRTTGILEFNKSTNAGIWNHLDLIKENQVEEYIYKVSGNPVTSEIIFMHFPNKICKRLLGKNPHPEAIKCIKLFNLETLDHYTKRAISKNPNTEIVEFLITNPAHIDLIGFSRNPHPKAVEYILKDEERIRPKFSKNPNPMAVQFLIKNPAHINYQQFSKNTNTDAVQHLLETPGRIARSEFSLNPCDAAVNFLFQNRGFIDWTTFPKNPNPRVFHYIVGTHQMPEWEEFAKTPRIIKKAMQYRSDLEDLKVDSKTIDRIMTSSPYSGLRLDKIINDDVKLNKIFDCMKKHKWLYLEINGLCNNSYDYFDEKLEFISN
jgi:hypothetical protein